MLTRRLPVVTDASRQCLMAVAPPRQQAAASVCPAGVLNSARDERASLQVQVAQMSSRLVELEGENEALR